MSLSMAPAIVAAVAMLALAQVTPDDPAPSAADPPASRSARMSDSSPPPTTKSVLDGFELGHLPDGLGAASDFAYEFDDVQFASRVWERSAPDGSAVDLTIIVMREALLTDVAAVREFLAGYHEQDPATWGKTPFDANGHPGFRTDDRVVVAVEPGVAVSVSIDRARFSDDDLTATALGATPPRGAKTGGQVTRPR